MTGFLLYDYWPDSLFFFNLHSFGVAELFDYRNHTASAVDEVSGGLHGIRLEDGSLKGITATDLSSFHKEVGASNPTESKHVSERGVFRRVVVMLSAQMLSLLDVFVFPDSLDASQPGSQLHGLALVRSTEKRVGSAQGPLLASLIRLSLLLLCHLEPCSVKLLQCSSRLRCFLHWIFELIRETETLEGYTAAFNTLTAPYDRLILAIVLQCHRTLGRCGSLLTEIESTPFETYFDSKESQKRSYRRLLRVALELRDILLTSNERRKEVLRTSMSPDAFQAFQSCLEPPSAKSSDKGSPSKAPPQKELAVRALLFSEWVTKFQDVDMKGDVCIPCMLRRTEATKSVDSHQGGAQAVEELFGEDKKIIDSFERSLDNCFEKYLEAQRKWAETGAVRDLEFDGDTTLKRLSKKHGTDVSDSSRLALARKAAVEVRWRVTDRKVTEIWKGYMHSKLPKYTDRLGRRILMVRNHIFDQHNAASYELLMGMEREKEEKEREERLRKKQELSEVMKRNSDAFLPFNEEIDIEDDDKEDEEGELDSEKEGEKYDPADAKSSVGDKAEGDSSDKNLDDSDSVGEHPIATEDVDAWAKSFIWSDNESVVARFDSVMIVTLQYLVEGNFLLTTHGLYFHQTGEEINTVTREPLNKSGANQTTILEVNDRRWRLSRLTEVCVYWYFNIHVFLL